MVILLILSFIAKLLIVSTQDCQINEELAQEIPAPEYSLWQPQIAYDMNANDSSVYIFDGSSWAHTIYKWNTRLNLWSALPSSVSSAPFATNDIIPFHSPVTNAVTIDGIVYFIGMLQYDPELEEPWDSANVYLFNLNTQNWMDNTNIHEPQYNYSLGCLTHNDSHIFMVGGDDKYWRLDRLQIYSISDNIWSNELMNFDPIQGHGWNSQSCQIVDDYLYVFGGIGGPLGGVLDIIWKYHAEDKWSEISPSLPHQQQHGVALHHRHTPFIYLVGGENDDNIWNSIFEFDVEQEIITQEYTMATTLAYLTAAIIGPKLYIFSGYDGNQDGSWATDVEICDILSTFNPTANPSRNPTINPTLLPTKTPTQAPTLYLTKSPTEYPTHNPTVSPTKSPSSNPSSLYTIYPTADHATTPTEGTQIPSHESTEIGDTFWSTNNERIVYVNNTDTLLIIVVVAIGVLLVVAALVIVGLMGYNKKVTQSNEKQIGDSATQFQMSSYDTKHSVIVQQGLELTDEGVGEGRNLNALSVYSEGGNCENNTKRRTTAAKTVTSTIRGSYDIQQDEFVVKGDDEMIDTMQ